MKVRFVRDVELNASAARQSVYQLETALTSLDYEQVFEFDHVVISAVNNGYAHETYIFPSNEEGEVLDWMELDGSYRGGTDHSQAIEYAGWTLVEEF